VGIVRLREDKSAKSAGQSNSFPRAHKLRTRSKSVISCSINHLNFHAEGDRDEVIAKFTAFLDREFAPIRAAIRAALTQGEKEL
jgi:hypothetical protein